MVYGTSSRKRSYHDLKSERQKRNVAVFGSGLLIMARWFMGLSMTPRILQSLWGNHFDGCAVIFKVPVQLNHYIEK